MNKISAVIITLNEEDLLQNCLDSIEDIADEIIVVDSFSTDKTEEICSKNKKLRFYHRKFDGYIEQRNYAVSLANNPYILAIDADEALSFDLHNSIKELKENWTHDYYSFNRLNNFCGKWIRYCGWYPDVKLRLFDSRKGKFGGINPHDRLEMIPGSTFKHLKGDLLHYSYKTISEHILQQNKFSDIKSQALFNNRKKLYAMKIVFSPAVGFIKSYFIKLGFLDGFYGFVICMNTAYYAFLTYTKLWDMNTHRRRENKKNVFN